MASVYSYDLDEGMLNALAREFDPEKMTQLLQERLTGEQGSSRVAVSQRLLAEFGRRWMERTAELGEKHTDRTYEVLKAAAARTGRLRFPHVAQRFLEIGYISLLPIPRLTVVENSPSRLTYAVKECRVFDILKSRCGADLAEQMVCSHLCLSAAARIYELLNLKARTSMEQTMARDGCCQFTSENLEK